jgi:Predicted membrane protein (DUF2254)
MLPKDVEGIGPAAGKLKGCSQMPLWLVPMIYAVASFAGGITLPRLEHAYFPYASGISIASAQAFFAAVASGMITLTGIVFSVGLVMVQFGAIAYSPRLVLMFARDPKLFHSLGVFIAFPHLSHSDSGRVCRRHRCCWSTPRQWLRRERGDPQQPRDGKGGVLWIRRRSRGSLSRSSACSRNDTRPSVLTLTRSLTAPRQTYQDGPRSRPR